MAVIISDVLEGLSPTNNLVSMVFDHVAPGFTEAKVITDSDVGEVQVFLLDRKDRQDGPFNWYSDGYNPPVGGSIIDLSNEYYREGSWVLTTDKPICKVVAMARGLAPGASARVVITRTLEDGAFNLVSAKVLEATVEIDLLDDLIELGGGTWEAPYHLAEWRAYRIALCRLIKAGITDATVWPDKPVFRQP